MTGDQCRDATSTLPPGAPKCDDGPLTWRLDANRYCETHGAWHAAVSPFAGYQRVQAPR